MRSGRRPVPGEAKALPMTQTTNALKLRGDSAFPATQTTDAS
jgi:hypothetical protein